MTLICFFAYQQSVVLIYLGHKRAAPAWVAAGHGDPGAAHRFRVCVHACIDWGECTYLRLSVSESIKSNSKKLMLEWNLKFILRLNDFWPSQDFLEVAVRERGLPIVGRVYGISCAHCYQSDHLYILEALGRPNLSLIDPPYSSIIYRVATIWEGQHQYKKWNMQHLLHWT